MISAFDVYLVMQLDNLKEVVFALSIIVGMLAAILLILRTVGTIERSEGALQLSRRLPHAAIFLGFCILLYGILPSSKTAAAMIILPAITSEEAVDVIKPEVRELLDLTKDALRSVTVRGAPSSSTTTDPEK